MSMDNYANVKFTIPGLPVAKKNNMIVARGRLIKDQKVREFEALVKCYAMSAMDDAGLPVIKHPVAMEITSFFSDKRRRDVQNVPAALCDALNEIVYEDDCQICHINMEKWLCEKGDERTEVKIWILPHDDRYPLTKK